MTFNQIKKHCDYFQESHCLIKTSGNTLRFDVLKPSAQELVDNAALPLKTLKSSKFTGGMKQT
jgi:hypothetical protein